MASFPVQELCNLLDTLHCRRIGSDSIGSGFDFGLGFGFGSGIGIEASATCFVDESSTQY